jgi:hypothetical protein
MTTKTISNGKQEFLVCYFENGSISILLTNQGRRCRAKWFDSVSEAEAVYPSLAGQI